MLSELHLGGIHVGRRLDRGRRHEGRDELGLGSGGALVRRLRLERGEGRSVVGVVRRLLPELRLLAWVTSCHRMLHGSVSSRLTLQRELRPKPSSAITCRLRLL